MLTLVADKAGRAAASSCHRVTTVAVANTRLGTISAVPASLTHLLTRAACKTVGAVATSCRSVAGPAVCTSTPFAAVLSVPSVGTGFRTGRSEKARFTLANSRGCVTSGVVLALAGMPAVRSVSSHGTRVLAFVSDETSIAAARTVPGVTRPMYAGTPATALRPEVAYRAVFFAVLPSPPGRALASAVCTSAGSVILTGTSAQTVLSKTAIRTNFIA